MSTKIYTGFRLEGYTLEQALRKMQAFSKEILLPVAQQTCHRRIVSHAVANLDARAAGIEPAIPEPRPLAEAWSALMDRVNEIEKTKRRDPAVDFDFEVTVFPLGSAILGITFVEQSEFHQLWLSQPDVEDYSYWNNTDQPEGLSDEAWLARAEDWDKALEHSSFPAQAGFSLTLCNGSHLFMTPVQSVEGLLPDFYKRVSAISRQLLMDEWDSRQDPESGQRPYAALRKYQAWLETDEGRARRAAVEKKTAELLNPELTFEHLMGG